jgi:hypothetical protein
MRKKTKLVCGIGINDADYSVHTVIDGRISVCKFYRAWHCMLVRCYSNKSLARRKTYIGCSVSKEWHSFMAFREWMIQQDWEGKQLDKDILKQGNKVYSPEYCVFITSQINSLLVDRSADRGNLPLGVIFHRTTFDARVSKNGKNRNLGCFKNKILAHAAWQKAKAEIIEQAANEQTDNRIKTALMLRVNQLRDDLANNRETKKI